MIKKATFLFVFICASSHLLAQVGDTTHISQFERLRNLQVNTWITDAQFVINPRVNNRDFSVTYKPNVKGQIGMSFGLKTVTLFLGVQIPGTESDPKRYGKTEFIDFAFGYFKNQYGGEIFYRNFEGVYRLQNDSTPRTTREDASLTHFGVSFYYVFNKKKFSYRSAISQQELQRKSAGSFVLLANMQHRSLVADSNMIPKEIDNEKNFGSLAGLTAIRFNTINVIPGYAYNLVFKKGLYFISPSVFGGVGIGSYNYTAAAGYHSGFNMDFDVHGKLSTGFNHKKWFGNIYITYRNNFNLFNSKLVSLQVSSFGINIGYRINTFFRIKWL